MNNATKIRLAWKYRRQLWKYRRLIQHRKEIAWMALAGAVLGAALVCSGPAWRSSRDNG